MARRNVACYDLSITQESHVFKYNEQSHKQTISANGATQSAEMRHWGEETRSQHRSYTGNTALWKQVISKQTHVFICRRSHRACDWWRLDYTPCLNIGLGRILLFNDVKVFHRRVACFPTRLRFCDIPESSWESSWVRHTQASSSLITSSKRTHTVPDAQPRLRIVSEYLYTPNMLNMHLVTNYF